MRAQQNRFNELSQTVEEKAAQREDERTPKKGLVNLSQALKHVLAGGEMKTLAPVRVGPTAKARRKVADDIKAEYATVMPIPVPLPGMHWSAVSQAVSGRPTEAVIKAMFVGKPNFRPVEGIMRDPMDPHYVKGGGKDNLCTIVHTNRIVRQANDIFARIAQLNETDFTPEELNQARAWCTEASYYCVANGPVLSCFKRYAAAAAINKPTGRYYFHPDTVEAVCAMLPWRKDYVRDMIGKMPSDCDYVDLNVDSSAGFPWDKAKKEVLVEAYQVATEILQAVREGTLEQLIKKHPQWMLVKLMNKLDRYDTRELLADPIAGVIRQYFVYGFHWVLLYSCLNQNVSQAMLGFWEDPKSFSAHGFAWQNGGPQRIIDWLRWASKQPPGLYGIAYSDDQLWVVVCQDGSWHILTLDYKRMDLNLLSAVGRLYHIYSMRVLEGKVDKTWTAVSVIHCKSAFTCPVIMEAAVVLETDNHLHSGVPGTPEFDQVASAAAFHHMRSKVGQPKDRADVALKVTEALVSLAQLTGLTVKPWEIYPGTEIDADPEDDYFTKWTFLGKHLCYVSDCKGWLPRSDPVRCIASLIAPKARQDGASGFRGQMQRVRQIVAAGGFVIPQVMWGATQWYRTCSERLGYTPADPFEPADQNLIDPALDIELALEFNHKDMPTFEECCNIYLPEGRKYDTRIAVAAVAGNTKSGVITASDLATSIYGPQKPETGVWSDSVEMPTATFGVDKGVSNIQPLKTVNPEMLGRARPKTAEEAAEALKRRKERWAEKMSHFPARIAAKLRSGATTYGRPMKGALSTKLGRALDSLVEAVDDHIDEEGYVPKVTIPYEDAQDELDAMDEFAEESYYASLDDALEVYVAEKNKSRKW